MSTKRCPSRKKFAIDYQTYFPVPNGHVVEVDELLDTFEVDEIDAGATSGCALCAQCGEFVEVILANDTEDGDDALYVMPDDREHWCLLNGCSD